MAKTTTVGSVVFSVLFTVTVDSYFKWRGGEIVNNSKIFPKSRKERTQQIEKFLRYEVV